MGTTLRTELDTHANGSPGRSCLTCSLQVRRPAPPVFPHSAWTVLGQGPIHGQPFQAACCLLDVLSQKLIVPGKSVQKPLEEILASSRMRGCGEEGARAERIGAARSQPGSFIETFLNNLHVLVSCVSNAVSGSVIPMGVSPGVG